METELELKGKRINLGAGEASPLGTTGKRLTYVVSGLFMLASVFNLIDYFIEGTDLGRHLFTSGMYFLAALLFLFKTRIELSSTSKYAPHFIISESGLKIKTGVFSKSQFFNWNDLRQIEIGKSKIGLKMNNTNKLIYYSYTARKSTLIKIITSIEAIATQKGLEVETSFK